MYVTYIYKNQEKDFKHIYVYIYTEKNKAEQTKG